MINSIIERIFNFHSISVNTFNTYEQQSELVGNQISFLIPQLKNENGGLEAWFKKHGNKRVQVTGEQ